MRNTMTVARLKEILEDLDDETEIRLMHQPSWPFEYSVAGYWVPEESEESEEHSDFQPGETDQPVLYLVEGRQIGYGTTAAWEEASCC